MRDGSSQNWKIATLDDDKNETNRNYKCLYWYPFVSQQDEHIKLLKLKIGEIFAVWKQPYGKWKKALHYVTIYY